MRRSALALALVAVVGLSAAGCGNKTKVVTQTNAQGQATTRTVPNVHFAKTKFILHTALAYGAFHRYIYKPFRAGSFKSGANGRVKAFAKAAAAALFAVHELKQSRRAAQSDSTLRGIGDRIGGILAKLGGLGAAFKASRLASGDVSSVAGELDSVTGLAKQAGVNVPLDKVPSVGG